MTDAQLAALHFANWRMGDVTYGPQRPDWLMLVGNPPFQMDNVEGNDGHTGGTGSGSTASEHGGDS